MAYDELRTMGDIVDHAKKFSNSTFLSTFWDNDDYTFVFHGTPYSTDNPSIYFFVVSYDEVDGLGDYMGQVFQVYMYHRSGGQASTASNQFGALNLAQQAALKLVDEVDKQSQPQKPAPSKRVITPAWRPF